MNLLQSSLETLLQVHLPSEISHVATLENAFLEMALKLWNFPVGKDFFVSFDFPPLIPPCFMHILSLFVLMKYVGRIFGH